MQLSTYQYATSSLGSACYIQGALSSLLLLAAGFHDNFEQGVLTNTNCGGNQLTTQSIVAWCVDHGTSMPQGTGSIPIQIRLHNYFS